MAASEQALRDSDDAQQLSTSAPTVSPSSQASSPLDSSSNATTSTATMRDEPEDERQDMAKLGHTAAIAGDSDHINDNHHHASSEKQGRNDESLEINHSEDRDGIPSQSESSSSSDSGEEEDNEEDNNDDDDPGMNHQQHHLPRQGLPSFWYALKRLNVTDPRSIIHSLKYVMNTFLPIYSRVHAH